jgi:RimJ/RimL family protein N-acetyltransferase
VDAVLGWGSPNAREVEEAARRLRSATCHGQVTDMAAQMAGADLAVGAGGISTWERCCVGLPSIVITVAANQEEATRTMGRTGHLLDLGPAPALAPDDLARALGTLLRNEGLREHFSRAGRALVDGRGAQRVAQTLLPTVVEVRRAGPGDCDDVHRWRNDPEVRGKSFQDREITLPEHRAWYARCLEDPTRALLIGEVGGAPIGVLRYDLDRAVATVSIYLVPGKLARGLGTSLLEAGTAWMREHQPGVRTLSAAVQPGNPASQGAFRKAGYVETRRTFELGLDR